MAAPRCSTPRLRNTQSARRFDPTPRSDPGRFRAHSISPTEFLVSGTAGGTPGNFRNRGAAGVSPGPAAVVAFGRGNGSGGGGGGGGRFGWAVAEGVRVGAGGRGGMD